MVASSLCLMGLICNVVVVLDFAVASFIDCAIAIVILSPSLLSSLLGAGHSMAV